jgi:hypothetical protein
LREGSGKLEETYYVTSRIYWKKLAQTASFVPENFENGGRRGAQRAGDLRSQPQSKDPAIKSIVKGNFCRTKKPHTIPTTFLLFLF